MSTRTKHVSPEHKQVPQNKINVWQASTAILAVLLVIAIVTGGFGLMQSNSKSQSGDEVAANAIKFINTNLLNGQGIAKIDGPVQMSNNLYRVMIDVNGQKVESYITLDGVLLFPQAINLTATPSSLGGNQNAAPADLPKTAKPVVEAFVMSYCPYGTQIEKGIIPAIKTLGDKVDFKLRFVNYIMHDIAEVKENVNQYCIQKEEPSKLLGYMQCFLNSSDQGSDASVSACKAQLGIDADKNKACIAAADTEFNVMKNYDDKSSWLNGRFPKFEIDQALNIKYGVQGSPTLVINGVQVNAGRDASSLLTAICGAYTDKPAECNTDLSAYGIPQPGFGYNNAGASASTNGGCGV